MKKLLFALMIILPLFSLSQRAQEHDIILKTTGQELEGSVTEIGDNSISFIYKNESLIYKIAKKDIVKITFASGRIEFYNKLKTQERVSQLPDRIPVNSNFTSHHNAVAVLPFAYVKNDRDGNQSMSNKIQNETINLLRQYGSGFSFQDPSTTNALLIKAGIRNNNIQGYTMGELCHILNVEYVLQGIVSIEKTGSTNYRNTFSTTKTKANNNRRPSLYVNRHGHIVGNIWGNNGNRRTTRSNTSSSSVSNNIQNFKTSITMNVFNDRGNNIYSKDHESFWNTSDAYKITLKYLIKRSPFYYK